MTVTVIRRDTAGEIPFDAIHKNAPASVRATAGIDIDEPSPEKTIIKQLVTIVNIVLSVLINPSFFNPTTRSSYIESKS